jgi:hypothetical protein
MECSDAEYVDQRALARGVARFNAVLLEVCAAEGLSCLDLAGMIPKSFDNFYDDAHLTEAGSRLTARAVADFIVKSGTAGHAHAP